MAIIRNRFRSINNEALFDRVGNVATVTNSLNVLQDTGTTPAAAANEDDLKEIRESIQDQSTGIESNRFLIDAVINTPPRRCIGAWDNIATTTFTGNNWTYLEYSNIVYSADYTETVNNITYFKPTEEANYLFYINFMVKVEWEILDDYIYLGLFKNGALYKVLDNVHLKDYILESGTTPRFVYKPQFVLKGFKQTYLKQGETIHFGIYTEGGANWTAIMSDSYVDIVGVRKQNCTEISSVNNKWG